MGKHDKTLRAIFTTPTPVDISIRDVEALLRAKGATIEEGSGSRFHAVLDGKRLDLHRPHPNQELKRYAVRKVAAYLTKLGIEPE